MNQTIDILNSNPVATKDNAISHNTEISNIPNQIHDYLIFATRVNKIIN